MNSFNSEWQIDIQSIIKKITTRKNIITILFFSLFGLVIGLVSYPTIASKMDFEVKVAINPTTNLQNPLNQYVQNDDMLQEFGSVLRSIKHQYVNELNDHGFAKKYQPIMFSSTITTFDTKINFTAKSSNKKDLEDFAKNMLSLSDNILKEKLAKNINEKYILMLDIANANKENIVSFVGSYDDLINKTKSFFKMNEADVFSNDIAVEYLQIMSKINKEYFDSTPQLIELQTLLENYNPAYRPVFYDTTTIQGKKAFMNPYLFTFICFMFGFVFSLFVVSISNSLKSNSQNS